MSLKRSSLLAILLVAPLMVACGTKTFTKGKYADPNEVALLDDQFNENDMQLLSNKLAESLIEYEKIKSAKDRPVIMVGQVKNRTSEHVDIKMLTDRVRTALIKTGRFSFASKEARSELAEEYEYQSSDFVDQETSVKKGGQLGVEYIITGDLGSNVQEVGKDKIVFYRMTMNLINVKTNIIEWSDDKEIRKRFRKRRVSS